MVLAAGEGWFVLQATKVGLQGKGTPATLSPLSAFVLIHNVYQFGANWDIWVGVSGFFP